ncbi:MAG: aminotransferase class I/II-fold pyridoxal phosphate-dependent enzyme [Tannerellaceae bacterium]|nr:aminotransferase class I/II-fold pyridoxal phosphate-dependent enzyme [Tannerellaceae bacterium]
MHKPIYLSLAHMSGYEQQFIEEAFQTNWVVPLGPNVDGFEKELAHYLGENRSVVALSTGTAAIHLALVQCGVEAADEVLCQSFTFAASANPIIYQHATPVFIDSEKDSWNMSPELLEYAIKDRIRKTGKVPKAMIPVHLYGMPAQIDAMKEIARVYDIRIIEDAAEALGSTYKGRKCGTFGEFAALSFNGNKMITTSGGGALVCSTPDQAKKTVFYATQARDDAPWYQHSSIGYNYRMSNICAGIRRGQMMILEEHIARRRAIHHLYKELFSGIEGIVVQENPSRDYQSNFWLTCILIDKKATKLTPEEIRLYLAEKQIESRPLWKPLHLQPVFSTAPFYGDGTSALLFDIGLCLPSGPGLSDEEIAYVAEHICTCIKKKQSIPANQRLSDLVY